MKSKFNPISNPELMDVAPRGVATQSSLSKWSKKNDAQRAVMGLNDDFSFHTDINVNEIPWWQLELDDIYTVDYIEIHNRKSNQYQDIARYIKILISIDGTNWKTIYNGTCVFGASPEGIPLILPFQETDKFRVIRIENLMGKHLHLNAVKIFSKVTLSRNKQLTFLANRTDGPGERLKTIIKGIAAAKVCNCNFLFSWSQLGTTIRHDTYHSVVEKELVFSNTFIEQHYIQNSEVDNLDKIRMKDLSLPLTADIKNKVCLIENQTLEVSFVDISKFLNKDSYINAFKHIKFSDRYTYILSLVDFIMGSRTNKAFHLRAGDIVYGVYKDSDRFIDKVIPFGLVVDILKNIDKKETVYIFGQDYTQLAYLKKEFNVVLANEIADSYTLNNAEKAFFEMYLMSKFKEVYAYPSAFSYVPTMIGECHIVNPSALYTETEIFAIIEASLTEKLEPFTNCQRTHSINFILKNYYDILPIQKKIDYTKLAKGLDLSNMFFQILHIVYLYDDMQEKNADKLMKALLLNEGELLERYLRNMNFYRSFLGRKSILTLRHHTKKNHCIDFFLFLIFYFAGEESIANEYKLTLQKSNETSDYLKEVPMELLTYLDLKVG